MATNVHYAQLVMLHALACAVLPESRLVLAQWFTLFRSNTNQAALCQDWKQWFTPADLRADQLTLPINRNTVLRAPLDANILEGSKNVLKTVLRVIPLLY